MARIARITGGFTLLVAGTAMLVLPGPGIVTIIAGLALLARDLPWAERLNTRMKERFSEYLPPKNGPKDDGAQAGG